MIHFMSLLCSSSVTGYVLFEIMGTLYEKKYPDSTMLYIGSLFIYIVLSITVAWIEIPILNVVYSLAVLCGLTGCLYKAYGKNVLINSSIVIIYLAIVDMIVTTIFSAIIETSTYNTLQEPKYFFISGIGNLIVILCTNKLVIQFLQRSQINKLSKYLNCYMVFLMFFEFAILCYFIWKEKNEDFTLLLLLICLGFVVLDIGVIYLYKRLSMNASLEKRTELIEQQLEMTHKYYENLQENYEFIQKVLHDTKKHLLVLNNLKNIDRGTEKAYADELLQSINAVQLQFQCSDKIVSAIIWNKIQICKQKDVEFEINMQDINFDFMDKIDITALFANLLDNAIEACQGSKEEKKIILRIHRFKEYIVIKLWNTIFGLPKTEGIN